MNKDLQQYKGCLAHLAFDPALCKGRRYHTSDEDGIMSLVDPFVDDVYRILNSKALRREKDKAQVFPNPDDPHIRTRRIHSDEVFGAGYVLANISGLNEALTIATALGHDMGHTVLGHLGESEVSNIIGEPFRHSIFSVVVAQFIERRGHGLNLTWETLECILSHSGANEEVLKSLPEEAKLGYWQDKIPFSFSDLQDLRRFGLDEADLPKVLWEFGKTQREQMMCCFEALIIESAERGTISFEYSKVAQNFKELKAWPYTNFYEKFDNTLNRKVLSEIYAFLVKFYPDCQAPLLLALLTDLEAFKITELLMKHPNHLGIKQSDIDSLHLGIAEIAPYLAGKKISMTDPDLGWGKDR